MLTALTKGGVEGFDRRVGADGGDGGHVQYAPDLGAATPDATAAAYGSAVAIERGQTSEGSNLFAGQGSQLRQMSKQSDRQHRSNPRHRPEQLVALAPDGCRADQIRQFVVEARQPLFQPTDVFIDAAANN